MATVIETQIIDEALNDDGAISTNGASLTTIATCPDGYWEISLAVTFSNPLAGRTFALHLNGVVFYTTSATSGSVLHNLTVGEGGVVQYSNPSGNSAGDVTGTWAITGVQFLSANYP